MATKFRFSQDNVSLDSTTLPSGNTYTDVYVHGAQRDDFGISMEWVHPYDGDVEREEYARVKIGPATLFLNHSQVDALVDERRPYNARARKARGIP